MTFRGIRQKIMTAAACILINTLFFWGISFASGGGEGAGSGNAHLWDLLYRIINFGLLVIILLFVMKKVSIKDFFSNRREEIRKKLDELKLDKEASEARYQELEKKLKEAETTKVEIIEQFRADGIAEKEKILSEAKKRASKILAHADLAIEREIKAARDRLRQELVEIAADRAQDVVAKNMTDSDQEHLVKEFIERVEKLH